MRHRRRHKLTRKASKRSFKKGSRVHRKNMRLAPMRGGIRF